ncbi:antibiotic biosynthesis monooxygenase [Williamsia sp. 1135]|uniref:antibiotic biosynthesis monooxygenase n=1 Tax=Williamsia sp. 1135 TaxID=1889262 RepID=UPI000A1065F9|nr:antibiotic biosynthesis monooxygenase [Williamsia sp. 1135]ORM29168.1 antibiotic biosynthesis monooxygenase [Williamsia sp. 1135]
MVTERSPQDSGDPTEQQSNLPDRQDDSDVTTSVARRIEPEREHDFVAWTDAGIALARTFPGFLGGGWVRSSKIRDEYYVMYRFETHAQVDDWVSSPVRKAWLSRGEGIAVEYATHRLSGIEGWFEPQSTLTNAVRILNAPPPRWKQAITIWLGFFPLSLAINFLVIAHLGALPLVVKTLIATLINTPLMVYLVLPWITARLKRWL